MQSQRLLNHSAKSGMLPDSGHTCFARKPVLRKACNTRSNVQSRKASEYRSVSKSGKASIHPVCSASTSVGSASGTSSRSGSAKVLPGTYDAVIVGGGISGLVTAQVLATQYSGVAGKFLVTEARERVGGNITSLEADGYVWEEGPNSFQPSDSILQAAVDAGVADELVLGDPKAPRFVYWDKKLRATPSGPDALTFDLLSIWGKIRAGLGAIGIKAPPPPANFEETVEQFIRRNLGDEVFYRLIEPFCSGVYAGDPTKLSMKAAFGRIWILEANGGSLVGGAIKLFQDRRKNPPPPRNPALPPKPQGQTVGSFRGGLKTLPEAIARKIPENIRVNWKLQSVTKGSDGLYSLVYDTPEGMLQLQSHCVALTVPAYVAAELFRQEVPAAADALQSFDYPPVGSVTLSYPVGAVRDDRKDAAGQVPGFGQLHPRTQGITTLGTIYSSSLFPGRAPGGEILVLNYIGGALNRGILDQTHEQLVEQVDKDLRIMLLKPDAPKPKVVGVRVWPRAIPQFNLGHLETLDKAKSALSASKYDGVLLGGNYVCGVALGKCVEYGFEFAKDISKAVEISKAKAGVSA